MKKLLLALSFVAASASSSLFAYEGGVDVKVYPKNDILISAEEAVKLIGKKGVMFVSGDSEDSYPNQHIRGSVVMGAHHLHHADIMGNLHCSPLYQCIEEAEHLIGEKGIDNDTLVIAYDDYRGPNATGVYSFFKSYGHKKVKVLMGGFKAIAELDPAKKKYDDLKNELRKAEKPGKDAEKDLKAYDLAVSRLERAKENKDEKAIARYQKIVDKGPLSKEEVAKREKIIASSNAKAKEIEAQMAKVEDELLVVKSKPLSDEKMAEFEKTAAAKAKNKSQKEGILTHLIVAEMEKAEGIHPKHYKIDPKAIDTSAIVGKEDVLHAVKDIQKNGKNSKYIIIDARAMTEIIGERKMDNVARGGHIPGATLLEWKHISDNKRGVGFKTPQEMEAVFKQYGITKDKTIYAYCHVGAGRSSEIITALEVLGYKNAKVYTGSWDEWGNDMSLPIKR